MNPAPHSDSDPRDSSIRGEHNRAAENVPPLFDSEQLAVPTDKESERLRERSIEERRVLQGGFREYCHHNNLDMYALREKYPAQWREFTLPQAQREQTRVAYGDVSSLIGGQPVGLGSNLTDGAMGVLRGISADNAESHLEAVGYDGANKCICLFAIVQRGSFEFVVPAWQPLAASPGLPHLQVVAMPDRHEVLHPGAGVVAAMESKHWKHGRVMLFLTEDAYAQAEQRVDSLCAFVTEMRAQRPNFVSSLPGTSFLVAALVWQVTQTLDFDTAAELLYDPLAASRKAILGITQLSRTSPHNYTIGVACVEVPAQPDAKKPKVFEAGVLKEHVECVKVQRDTFGFISTEVTDVQEKPLVFG